MHFLKKLADPRNPSAYVSFQSYSTSNSQTKYIYYANYSILDMPTKHLYVYM